VGGELEESTNLLNGISALNMHKMRFTISCLLVSIRQTKPKSS